LKKKTRVPHSYGHDLFALFSWMVSSCSFPSHIILILFLWLTLTDSNIFSYQIFCDHFSFHQNAVKSVAPRGTNQNGFDSRTIQACQHLCSLFLFSILLVLPYFQFLLILRYFQFSSSVMGKDEVITVSFGVLVASKLHLLMLSLLARC